MRPPVEETAMSDANKPVQPELSRRRLFAAGGTAGALAAVAAALPLAPGADVPQAAGPQPEAEPAGGYQLTQHVLRYYETTRV
jgi:hypothetical protein